MRARWFSVFACAAALVASGASPGASADAGVPISKLSLPERLRTAPDATAVQLGTRTTTLGALRAAHRARLSGLLRARALGTFVHGKLAFGPQPFIEPPSQYANAPADMKAFCAAAQASACLYLPPGQEVTIESTGVSDWDGMVTQPQCAQQGGVWQGMWNAYFCAFTYPAAVTTHFAPAANFKVSQSAQCDTSMYAYKVDTHGAVSIWTTVAPVIMTTGPNVACVVTVTPGG